MVVRWWHPDLSGLVETSRREQELHAERGEIVVDGSRPAAAANQPGGAERGQVLRDRRDAHVQPISETACAVPAGGGHEDRRSGGAQKRG